MVEMKPAVFRHTPPDSIIGLLLALGSAWYLWEAWRLPRFQLSVVVDAHVFPMVVGLVLLVCAIVLAARPERSAPPEGFTWRSPLVWRAFALVGLGGSYALVLERVGFVISTFVFLLITPAVLGWRRWAVAAVVAGVFALGVQYLFDELLMVPLPSGVWPF